MNEITIVADVVSINGQVTKNPLLVTITEAELINIVETRCKAWGVRPREVRLRWMLVNGVMSGEFTRTRKTEA